MYIQLLYFCKMGNSHFVKRDTSPACMNEIILLVYVVIVTNYYFDIFIYYRKFPLLNKSVHSSCYVCMRSYIKTNKSTATIILVKIEYFVLFVGVLFVCSQMNEPHSGLTLKCAKCGVVSTTALSATTASNAMLV